MTNLQQTTIRVCEQIHTVRPASRRRMIALAGPPGSGKSTLAESVANFLNASGTATVVIPMDGFHLDNRILEQRGRLPRKGAPDTFDVHGFVALIARIASEDSVIYPIFDRDRDLSIAGAAELPSDCETVIVEGNYLLLDAPVWRDLMPYWDMTIGLNVPEDTLRKRLIQRWIDHGLSADAARARAESNDIPNALLVAQQSRPPDLMV